MLNIITDYKFIHMFDNNDLLLLRLMDHNNSSMHFGDLKNFTMDDHLQPVYLDLHNYQSCVGNFYGEPFSQVKSRILLQNQKTFNLLDINLPFTQIPIYDFITVYYYGKSTTLDKMINMAKLVQPDTGNQPFNLLWYLSENSPIELFPIIEFYMHTLYNYNSIGEPRSSIRYHRGIDSFKYYPIEILDEMVNIDCGNKAINDIMYMVYFVHKGYIENGT